MQFVQNVLQHHFYPFRVLDKEWKERNKARSREKHKWKLLSGLSLLRHFRTLDLGVPALNVPILEANQEWATRRVNSGTICREGMKHVATTAQLI